MVGMYGMIHQATAGFVHEKHLNPFFFWVKKRGPVIIENVLEPTLHSGDTFHIFIRI